jgi:iron complex outermembrane receptor protein
MFEEGKMREARFLAFLVLGFLIFSCLAEAAEEEAPKLKESKPVMMKEVVVTATRYTEEIATLPTNVTLITEEDIAKSTAKDVPSLLRTQVGIHVMDITGNRRSYRVDIRGFGETSNLNTLVLVDGRRTNQPDLSGADWALIPLDRIKRIEIVRGSRASVLYGDNATGGVINIITKEGETFKAGIKGAGGSYDTISTDAYVRGTHKSLSYALSGSLYDTEGYRDNSAIYAEDLGLNLAYPLGDVAKVNLKTGYHKDETRLPGGLRLSELAAGIPRTGTTKPNDFSDTQDHYVQLSPEIFLFQDSHFKLPLSYRKRDTFAFASFAGGNFRGDTEIKTAIASPQFVIKEPLSRFDNHLTFGFDYSHAEEDIFNESLFFGMTTIGLFELEKKNYAYYIHDEFFPISTLALSGGYRHDKVEYTFSSSTPTKTDFDENLFTAGVNYNLYRDSYLYFSFSDGFRYPVLDELFSFFTNTINTNLVPQTSENYEVGVRHHFTETLYGNVNFFRLDTKNEIFFNPTTFANENLDGVTRRDGVEIALGAVLKGVNLTGSYTYTDPEIRGGQFSGKEIPNVPKHQATLNAVLVPREGFTLALNGIYVGKRFFESDFPNAFPKQDDYIVFNGKLSYNRIKWTVFLDVNNIFNEEYSEFGVLATFPTEPAFFPSPEINFLFGVRYDY